MQQYNRDIDRFFEALLVMSEPNRTELSPAESEIMDIVWDRGEVSVAEVREILSERRDIARNTVQTLMTRMEEKGWLKHRPIGRAFLYSATQTRRNSHGASVQKLLDELFKGSAEELMTALVEYRGISVEEARRIQKLLDEAADK